MLQEINETKDDRSLGELFSALTQEATTLMRQEVALAKAEMSQKLLSLVKNVGFLVAGGAVAYTGLLALLAALVLGTAAAGLPLWASALLVGGVLLCLSGFLVMQGLKALKNADPVPQQTVETLKEDIEWAKQQTH